MNSLQGRGKVRKFSLWSGNLEGISKEKVREFKKRNMQISENILFCSSGKDVLFREIVQAHIPFMRLLLKERICSLCGLLLFYMSNPIFSSGAVNIVKYQPMDP